MTNIFKNIGLFWRLFLRGINIPFLLLSLALALALFLGSRYMAKWSSDINLEVIASRYNSHQEWDMSVLLSSSPSDVKALVSPYLNKLNGNQNRTASMLNRYNLSLDDVSFSDEASLLGWLYNTGREKEEMNILRTESSSDPDSEKLYSFIHDYLKKDYFPLVIDAAKRGDYYIAKALLDKLFNIYSLSKEFPAFSSEMNRMFILYAVLQDRWAVSTHRPFTKDVIDQILDDKLFKTHLTADINIAPSLSYIGEYFEGLHHIRAKEYDEAFTVFAHIFEKADFKYLRELSALMVVRCAVWKYDISHNLPDYQNALRVIRKYSNSISLPYFKADLKGYTERLDSLRKQDV